MSKLIKNYKSTSETILTSRRDIFFSLCKSIIGKQISVAEADAFFLRFQENSTNKINDKHVQKLTYPKYKNVV